MLSRFVSDIHYTMENSTPIHASTVNSGSSAIKTNKTMKSKSGSTRKPLAKITLTDDNNSYSTTDTSGEFEERRTRKMFKQKKSKRRSSKKSSSKTSNDNSKNKKYKSQRYRSNKHRVSANSSAEMADQSSNNDYEESPSLGFQLRTATIHNKVHEMERLLRKDPSLVNDAAALGEHGAVESGLTALHVACQLGHDECVGLLILRKADVNIQTEGGNTPLHFACAEGHSGCVEQLINAGAKTHLKDILDQSPKDVARLACKRQWDICVDFIEAEEVRFGYQVLKVGASIATLTIAAVVGVWYWNNFNDSSDDRSNDTDVCE